MDLSIVRPKVSTWTDFRLIVADHHALILRFDIESTACPILGTMGGAMSKLLTFVLMVVSVVVMGCNPSPTTSEPVVVIDLDALDDQRAFEYVSRFVAIRPRDAGTPGAAQAARWIHDAIEPFVDNVKIDTFKDKSPMGEVDFHNVLATLPGTGPKTVILGSHFDTKSGISETFQGANDSGSSTGLLIALARVLQSQPRLPFSIVFAFFDGEECMREYGPRDGLHGSRHYARKLESAGQLDFIQAVIVLDMIGDKDLTVTIPRNTTRVLTALAFKAAEAEGIRQRFGLARGGILDDHVPFYDRGVPTLNLIDFEHGSAPGLNDYWHTEQDSLDNISAESLQHVGRVTLRILNFLATQQNH